MKTYTKLAVAASGLLLAAAIVGAIIDGSWRVAAAAFTAGVFGALALLQTAGRVRA